MNNSFSFLFKTFSELIALIVLLFPALQKAPDTLSSPDRIHFLKVGSGDAILLESGGRFAMVDAGEDSDNPRGFENLAFSGHEKEVLEYLKAHAAGKDGKVHLDFVLGTHAHSDHIYGLEELIKRFPKVKIYTNATGVDALKSPKLNISHYHSEYPDISIDAPDNVCVLKEGDSLEVLGMPVQVYETPGHAPSCLTYVISQMVFTGDSYIPGVKVFTGFPHANKKQAESSVERILQISADCQIMPGHS